jgi:molecular chaperone IbpA
MTKLTPLDIRPFFRNSIGIDRLFDDLFRVETQAHQSNFPPYNVIKNDEDNYTIELAIAGYKPEEIDVTIQDGWLHIVGEKTTDAEVTYLHQGISNRRFTRQFKLSDYVEVRDAGVQNGMLTIQLQRILPETMKPRKIELTVK